MPELRRTSLRRLPAGAAHVPTGLRCNRGRRSWDRTNFFLRLCSRWQGERVKRQGHPSRDKNRWQRAHHEPRAPGVLRLARARQRITQEGGDEGSAECKSAKKQAAAWQLRAPAENQQEHEGVQQQTL